MAKLFNFTRLINKYSRSFTLITPGEGGGYVGCKWVAAEPVRTIAQGAIVPVAASNSAGTSADSQLYHPGGAYIEGVRRLYMLSPISKPLKGAQVECNGDTYQIEQDTDYGDIAGVYIYMLKRVDLLDKHKST